MPKPPSQPLRWLARFASALALASLALAASPARADILGECSAITDLITCAATDVGKPCQGGGKCLALACSQGGPGSTATMVYRCEACPTIISVPAGTCTLTNMGTACGGDGGAGTCGIVSSECQTETGADKISCQTPSTEKPTGPPAGEGGSSSGCDIAPGPPKPAAIGVGLLAAGLLAFLIDRARRRSR
ncbi:MAG TPA: hypothetical protein VHL80_10800 [Polyangia bacterium]|nr:hypothetical protein [Polyangia bacterium]